MKSMYCSTVTKTSCDSFLGLHLWSPPNGSCIILVNIDEQGLFAGKLKVGMQIDCINGKSCRGLSVAEIDTYLGALVGHVTILASAPQHTSRLCHFSTSEASRVTEASLPDELSLESLSLQDSICSIHW